MSERRCSERMRSKFFGGMLGSGLGDAIGEVAFRRPSEKALRSEIEARDRLAYTDDTAMAIGLAESLVELGDLDPQHLGDTFRKNFRREPWRGYASGPPTVFSLVERQGVSYREAAQRLFGGEGSFGNGAAMRIAPVGLFFHDATDLYERARLSASVTHAHAIGVDGAAIQARAVAMAVGLDPDDAFPGEDFCQALLDFARTGEMRDKLALVHQLLGDEVTQPEAARRLGRSVAVHESLPFAIYSFLRHPESFEGCLVCATLNGGDRDTLGAMACAISGAYLGVGATPARWRGKLENVDRIKDLALRLAEVKLEASGQ